MTSALRRAAGAGGLLLLAASCAWGVGFAWFTLATERPGPPPPRADGIVALTGGPRRIEAALALLAADRAPVLLVSGVARGIALADLARRGPALDPDALAARVTLGREATSTHTNAVETAQWARAHGIRSVIVVTSGPHMPRALAEIGRALPDAALHPSPVALPAPRGLDAAAALATEFDKLLAVHLLSWLLPWSPGG